MSIVYRVDMVRVGRHHSPQPLMVQVPTPLPVVAVADRLAEAVYRWATGKAPRGRPLVASRSFDVEVGLDDDGATGSVSIEHGRFGTGTVVRL